MNSLKTCVCVLVVSTVLIETGATVKVAAIAGGTIGGFFVAIVIVVFVLVILILWTKKRNKHGEGTDNDNGRRYNV